MLNKMEEKIYTIPVNEAFEKNGECAFCEMSAKLDDDILEYVLGPSYMEEDVREETDKHGFCKYHYNRMFHAQNSLGVALMVSSHLKKINKDFDKLAEKGINAKKSLFSKEEVPPLIRWHETLSKDCYACKRAEGRMNSYINTFFYLWKHEAEFKDKVMSCKGFCLEHFMMLMSEGAKRMKAGEFEKFKDILIPLQKENMLRIDKELDWYIQKFDYRFKDEPWKDSKDSPERAILKISSTRV